MRWSSEPITWPGDLGDGVIIEHASFAFDSLRVIGDAGPGDPRTTANGFIVRWDGDTQPSDIMFAEAPTGVYSQLSLSIDGQLSGNSLELRGRVFIDSEEWEFRVEDDDSLDVTIPISYTLAPPASAVVELHVDFAHALGGIDFEALEVHNGRLELEDGDDQMDAFRDRLIDSFQIADGGGR